jgi:hypothetical protein
MAVFVIAGSNQTTSAQAGTTNRLISVAFKTNNPYGNSPLVSGPEPAATDANALFGAANVWNNLPTTFSQNVNPAWSNLVDSTGTATGVNLSITGTVGATDFWPWASFRDPLRSAFIFWNSWTNGGGAFGPGESTSITWTLTGLPPATTFDMCVYGSFADIDRSFDMTIQDTAMSIPTFNSANSPLPNCVLFTNITSDGHGTISGVADGVGDSTTAANEADWSGFQLVEVASGKGRKIGFHRSITH